VVVASVATCSFTTALTGAITAQSAVVVEPFGILPQPTYAVSGLTQTGFTVTFSAPPSAPVQFYYVVVE
jgi:hypothetical protein